MDSFIKSKSGILNFDVYRRWALVRNAGEAEIKVAIDLGFDVNRIPQKAAEESASAAWKTFG